jgi:ABC-type nitrate/sulfonate/bicarbonate transport system permease component
MATDKIFVDFLVLGLLGLLADRVLEILINRYASRYRA